MKFKLFAFLPAIPVFLLLIANLSCSETKVQSQAIPNTDKNSALVKSDVIDLKPSTILKDIEEHKKTDPQLAEKDLIEFGNALLQKKGFNYDISICEVIDQKKKTKQTKAIPGENEYDKYVSFPYRTTLTNSTQKTFRITAPDFESCCCGYCYTEFPVLNITGKQMTLIADGKTFSIKRTKELSVSDEHLLVDNKTRRTVIRKWQVPFEAYPYGVSKDGTKLYIDLFDEIQILLEISEIGNLKFVSKSDPNIIAGGKDLRTDLPPKVGEILYKSGYIGYYIFKSGKQSFIVKFPYPCT